MRLPMLAATFALAATTFAAFATAGAARADEAARPGFAPAPAAAPAPVAALVADPEPVHSINMSPLGIAFGSYSLNYEHLSPGGHGVLVEVGWASSGNDNSESTSQGALIGYRWHWRGQQNSGFLGVSLSASTGTGTASIDVDGTTERFELGVNSIGLTGNVGKRWQFESGLNVTLRIGLGYGVHKVSSDSTDPDAQKAIDAVNELLTFLPVAAEGELSVGYSF